MKATLLALFLVSASGIVFFISQKNLGGIAVAGVFCGMSFGLYVREPRPTAERERP